MSKWTLKSIEKAAYLLSLGGVALGGGFVIYRKNVLQAESRAEQIKKTETKYLKRNPDNMVKLQNFQKKVFAIGVVDDIVDESMVQQSDDHKVAISKNAAMIRDFIKEVGAENVVLELCDERYEDELYEIISHPNYDRTFNQVHKVLSQKRPQRLLKFEDQISVNQGNFEFLVGLDTCSYRTQCKTVLGDRDLSLTQKRFQAKAHLLELYKEQYREK